MPEETEFRAGPFSVGDIIALASVLITAGAMYANLAVVMKEQDRQAMRLQALEQVVPSEYVKRNEYREDRQEVIRTIQDGFNRLESKLDTKVDK